MQRTSHAMLPTPLSTIFSKRKNHLAHHATLYSPTPMLHNIICSLMSMSIYTAHYRTVPQCAENCWNRCVFDRRPKLAMLSSGSHSIV